MILGAMSALITPFKNGKVDSLSYERIIQRQAKYGMDACVPVGTTGESATLSHKEHMECIEIAVSVCKQNHMKVLAGAGSNSTHEAIELAQFAQKIGADGILCVTPYYNKPTQKGLFEHYKAIAKSIEIPMMLYNVPSRTGVNIEVSTALKLFEEVENIYGIKEATGLVEHIVALHSASPKSIIASGEDAINYPILASGGKAVISVTGNLLPDKISDLTHCATDGEFERAREINEELYAINKALFCETNPVPIKTAMFLSGLIETLEFRLPLVALKKENLTMLEKILEKYEVLQ
ncbi:4-hydroxy-tetrahydrodipicolinate synthase [Helicobacter kayseriensis]|uniref:4-hydroxy-tetrahydrodipicolinate synthase n=1 Tax=Helicobacter kayseriensis TaxID=2905877 RepID=UPI001E3324CE|nr:4-hydroxy-tetrahydrodipicolinate synthase [Helicobacter kayseriensis]MCE3047249.1 4-hydroxy-tetrahydrodipicolinate synthase [Helicobacter kayseriensis]MCE3048620.1 4-hydroxy-tetrahydrodipicolinate synthase [Helicobacter kayseriensis]